MFKRFSKAAKMLSVAMMGLLAAFTFSTTSYAQEAASNDILLYIVVFPGDCEGEVLALPDRLPETVTPSKDKSNKFSFKECRTICQSMPNCTGFSFSKDAKASDRDDTCNLKKVKNKYCPAVERIANDMNYYSKINVLPKDAVAPVVDLSAQAPVPAAPIPEQVAPAPAPDAMPAAPAPVPEQALPPAQTTEQAAPATDTQPATPPVQDQPTLSVEPDPV